MSTRPTAPADTPHTGPTPASSKPTVSTVSTSHTVTLDNGTEVATRIVEPRPGHSSRDSLGDIVICHGTPWSSHMWMPLARELGQRFRVHLWDMPGYGESIPIPDESPAEVGPLVDLIAQRRRLGDLLDYWKLETPHVIAHDIGGAVALGAHLLEGLDFASLYLLDVVTLTPWGSPFFQLVAENESAFAALPPRLHRALVREYIAGSGTTDGPSTLTASWLDELTAPWATAAGQRAFYRQITQLSPAHTQPIVDRLGEVRCPVRIGWGDDDQWISVEQAERLAHALPRDTDITHFPGAGHLVPIEAPTQLAAEVAAWLESCIAAATGT